QLTGDVPLAAALATCGETAKDYVTDVYQNNLFAPNPPFWSYPWQKQAWADGGSREGFASYFTACHTNFAARGIWETATNGDQSFEMGYYRNAPYWHLFQMLPDTIVPGKWPVPACTSVFSGIQGSNRGLWSIQKAATRFSDPIGRQLARWNIDQSM